MGKVVAFCNPVLPGMGSTTLSIATAVALAWWGHKKTLLINCAQDNMMEVYLSDVQINYSLDYLKVLGGNFGQGSLETITTHLNSKLDIIGGYSILHNREKADTSLLVQFLKMAATDYDFVILELSNNNDSNLLALADILIPVCPFHLFWMNELGKKKSFMELTDSKDVFFLFNRIGKGVGKELAAAKLPGYVKHYFSVAFDKTAYTKTSLNKGFYRSLIKKFDMQKDEFSDDILEFAFELMKCADSSLIIPDGKKTLFDKIKKILGRSA